METIEELAGKWNKTENYILRMIKKECYQTWTFVSFYGYEVKGSTSKTGALTYNRPWELIEKFVRIPDKLIEGFLVNNTLKIGFFLGDTDATMFRPCEENKQYELYSEMPTVSVTKKALCVKLEDAISMEEKHPELLGKTPEPLHGQHEQIAKPNIKESEQETEKNNTGSPQETKSQNGLLKVIGGLLEVHYLMKSAVTFRKSNGEININKLSIKITDDIQGAGFNTNGLGDRTLRHILSEAIEQIEQNKDIKK
jgi:hypothetical protein